MGKITDNDIEPINAKLVNKKEIGSINEYIDYVNYFYDKWNRPGFIDLVVLWFSVF